MTAEQYIKGIEEGGLSNWAIPATAVRAFCSAASEDDFTQMVAAPLLRNMGFKPVRVLGHKEKGFEFGQDIRYMKYCLPTGHTIYFTAQVKAGRVDASAGGKGENISGLIDELRMCFDNPIVDLDTNSEHMIDHAFLVTSGTITRQAEDLLGKILRTSKRRNILFMDQDQIIQNCIEFGLPKGCCEDILTYSRLETARRFVEAMCMLDPGIEIRISNKIYTTDSLKREITNSTPLGKKILRSVTHFRWSK